MNRPLTAEYIVYLFEGVKDCQSESDWVHNKKRFVELIKEYGTEQCNIANVVGRSEQLKAEDKDLPFADYLEKWYELPRYEKVYDRKDGKGTDTEDEVIKNYRRAFRL